MLEISRRGSYYYAKLYVIFLDYVKRRLLFPTHLLPLLIMIDNYIPTCT